ncbi:MAG: DKNYY domain-containing protein [Patescibacteria group bacterium]|nr:DKNYY domain-containing protein [Patescibacteria group bacterium]
MKNLIISVAALIGSLFGINNQQISQPTLTPVVQTQPSGNTPGLLVEANSEWKIYTNDKYGFELSYPSDWHVTDDVQSSEANPIIFRVSPDSCDNPSCMSNRTPAFFVRTIGDLDLAHLQDGSLKADEGWKIDNFGNNTRYVYYQNRDLNVAMVASNEDIRNTESEIFSSFKQTNNSVIGNNHNQASATQKTSQNGTFAAYPSTGSAPLGVQFTDTIQTAGDISIDYGDGTSCSTSNPGGNEHCTLLAHTYVNPGTYTAILYRHLPTTELARTIISVTETTNSSSISVAGMARYIDPSFGFSFWYPSTWTVQSTAIKNSYAGGMVKKTLTISSPSNQNGWSGTATIDEYYSPGSEITIARDLCSPMSGSFVAAHRYYFNFNAHTWMIETPAYTGTSERDGSTYSVAASTKAADVSNNTMGGLHMLGAGCSGAVIPLSAYNFVVFTFNSRDVGANYINIAKTITATDPSVATPVSTSEQIQTITHEGVLLGGIGTQVGQWYVTSEHVYDWGGNVVPSANPSTFRLINTYSDGTTGTPYATDGTHVFAAWSPTIPILDGANPATFVAIRQPYQIPYVPSSGRYGQSFTSYDTTFAKDKSHVWYESRLIPGADPNTFVVTGDTHVQNSFGGYTLAHDARHTYGTDSKGNFTIDGSTNF